MSGYGLEVKHRLLQIKAKIVSILLCLDTGWKEDTTLVTMRAMQFQSSYVWIRVGSTLVGNQRNGAEQFQSSYVWIRAGRKKLGIMHRRSYYCFNPLMSGYGLEDFLQVQLQTNQFCFNPLMSGYGLEDPSLWSKGFDLIVSILLCLDTGWKITSRPPQKILKGFNPLMSGYGLEDQIEVLKALAQIKVSILLCLDTGWKSQMRNVIFVLAMFQSSYVWIRAGSIGYWVLDTVSERFNPLMSGYGLEATSNLPY